MKALEILLLFLLFSTNCANHQINPKDSFWVKLSSEMGLGLAQTQHLVDQLNTYLSDLTSQQSQCSLDFCPTPTEEQKKKDSYDMVLRIDRAEDIGLTGWSVESKMDEQQIRAFLNSSAFMVSLVGFYNSGKSMLLNMLIDKQLPSGSDNSSTTRGLSMIKGSGAMPEHVLFIDTEGSRRAVEDERLPSRLYTDYVLQELALQMAGAIIFMVETLFVGDVAVIKQIRKKLDLLRDPKTGQKPRMIVVHNFYKFFDEPEVDLHIDSDVVKAFNARENTIKTGGRECKAYVDPYGIMHFILGRENSPAGAKWNSCTLDVLRSALQTYSFQAEHQNIKERVEHSTSAMLPLLFFHPRTQNLSLPVLTDPRTLRISDGAASSSNQSLLQRLGHFLNSVLGKGVPDLKEQCKMFLEFNNDVFLVEFSVNSLNSTVRADPAALSPVGTIKLKSPADLKFFPLSNDSLKVPPDVTFSPGFDILQTNTHWIIKVDVMDSKFKVFYSSTEVKVYGCRVPSPEDYAIRERSIGSSRKFSTFQLNFNIPDETSPSYVDGQEESCRHEDTKDGVLVIKYTRCCSSGIFGGSPECKKLESEREVTKSSQEIHEN